MDPRTREHRGRHGLVSSVSGVLTKQGFGLWSREPSRHGFVLRDVSEEVSRAIVDVDGGRAVVQSEDPAIVARMESVELCGTPVQLADPHSFTL